MSSPFIARLQRLDLGSHFSASTLRGGAAAEPIDPFLGVDHARVSGPTFAPHPHAGFSVVSYLFVDSETGIANRDSLGNRNLILPGGLHWTAAGRGVVHEEVPAETGRTVHMLQIFVNLPRDRQGDAPYALSLAPQDVPVVQQVGARIRVPLGRYGQAQSPLAPPTAVTLLDISLDQGAELAVPVAAGDAAFVMPINGSLEINGLRFHSEEWRLPAYPAQPIPQTISLKSREGAASAAFFTGTPLRQPVHWYGSLALASSDALAAAVAAYQRGDFGTV